MKKLLAMLLVLMMALPLSAMADSTEAYRFLRVDGCKEWVSLREEASVRSDRIRKIPLGAMVQSLGESENGYVLVCYGGDRGYVLRRYLFDRDDQYDIPMYAVNCRDYVSLREYPDTDSKRLEKILPGDEVTAMCYGFQFSEGQPHMARVLYTDQKGSDREGFVNGNYLSFLPEDGSVKIQSASLHINKADGDLFVQTLSDRDTLDELQQMILDARPGEPGKCPLGALLELNLSNGRTLYFTYPVDGCSALIAQNACIYVFDQKDTDRFWELFDQAQSCML